jgi:hypothetical protein
VLGYINTKAITRTSKNTDKIFKKSCARSRSFLKARHLLISDGDVPDLFKGEMNKCAHKNGCVRGWLT